MTIAHVKWRVARGAWRVARGAWRVAWPAGLACRPGLAWRGCVLCVVSCLCRVVFVSVSCLCLCLFVCVFEGSLALTHIQLQQSCHESEEAMVPSGHAVA